MPNLLFPNILNDPMNPAGHHPSSGHPALEVRDAGKTFAGKQGKPDHALRGISFRVGEGAVVALVGPDGAGKTTMLRVIAGLMKQDQGTVEIFGRTMERHSRELREMMGYMPQKFGLYEDLTVQENLDLYADLKGLAIGERESRYHELLSMTSMEPFRDRLAGRLSGGMKQKLGLICTLVRPPRLLLLDEPTVGVDPLSRRELWSIIGRLAMQAGMSVVISTSYLDEAAKCDEIVLLFEGGVLAQGKPEEIRKMSEGLACLVTPLKGETARELQTVLWNVPGVLDAVPEGGEVRFVRHPSSREGAVHIPGGRAFRDAEATLEDSFMLLLRAQLPEPDITVKAKPVEEIREQVESDPEPVIETRGVYRMFGDFIAVNDVSFDVFKGEIFGLLGPNGAGKTTTFRMLCGLLPATRGTLKVAGVDVRKAREEARRHLGYVAQKFSLYGSLTVRQNLDFFAGAYDLRGEVMEKRIAHVIEDFSLGEHLDSVAGDLPGGYKQRLAMAVGLLHEPSILFLDEPTSGADPLARREFWKRISGLASQGVTVIVTTHFMEEAEYCDRVLIQSDGVMLALDTPANIRRENCSSAQATMEDAFIAIVERGRKEKGTA